METQNDVVNARPRERKKISVEIVQFAKHKSKEGVPTVESIAGVYLDQSKRPWLDKETGEQKEITQFHMRKLESDEQFVLFADAGLLNEFSLANVKVNDEIEIEWTGTTELKGGRRVNNYTIYRLQ